MDLDKILGVVGGFSNVASAICALIAICVTVKENQRIRSQARKIEDKRFLSARYETLCIDRIVVLWDDLYCFLRKGFYEIKTDQIEEERITTYDKIEEECKKFEVGVRFIKLFDKELYKSVADQIEKINDIVAECVNNHQGTKWRISESQTTRYLTRIGECGYKIIEKMHKFECEEIWKADGNEDRY